MVGKTEVALSGPIPGDPLLGELGPDPGALLLTDVSVTSYVLFLYGFITFPSFLLSNGLLLLSATFCFNLERTFRLGSEAVFLNGKSSFEACVPGSVYLYDGGVAPRGGEL